MTLQARVHLSFGLVTSNTILSKSIRMLWIGMHLVGEGAGACKGLDEHLCNVPLESLDGEVANVQIDIQPS